MRVVTRRLTRTRSLPLMDRQAGDSDGTIISYTWSQISNGAASVIIAGADSAQATFQAPEVNTDTVLEFQLRVVDNSGGADTDPR